MVLHGLFRNFYFLFFCLGTPLEMYKNILHMHLRIHTFTVCHIILFNEVVSFPIASQNQGRTQSVIES